MEAARCKLRCEWPPLAAADCELRWEHGEAAVAVGASTEVVLVPRELHLGKHPCPQSSLNNMPRTLKLCSCYCVHHAASKQACMLEGISSPAPALVGSKLNPGVKVRGAFLL